MKKITICILILIFFLILFFSVRKEKTYKVLKVNSVSEFYIDTNLNKVADVDELVTIDDLNHAENKFTRIELAQLSYLSNNFAKKILLNQNIEMVKDKDNKVQIILPDKSNYRDLLIQKGFVLSEQNYEAVKKNIDFAKTLNLVSYNLISHNFHKLTCKYALISQNVVLLKPDELPKSAVPCVVCHTKNKKYSESKYNKKDKYPRDVFEKYEPVYKDSFVEFYVTDFTKYFYPSSKCRTTPCKSLLNQINNARSTIDFAIYGVDNQPEITDALLRAQNRGVNIRWVYDTDKKGKTIYIETFKLKKNLRNGKSDNEINTELLTGKYKDSIMHNKFFVFDSKRVWTGSANITHTDLSGFNANSAILINSEKIAQIYKREFEQMFGGRFHKLKNKTDCNKTNLGSSEIEVYFSPQDNAITNNILPLIESAQRYIYVPVFVITHKDFNQALINAKKRGVDVKIIVDATNAGGKYSSVKLLREGGVPVKSENRAGKMHMKSMIIDDKYVILGSMNFSKSGEKYNDENVLIIKNPDMAKSFKSKFLYFWKEIPDKWLMKNPGAESWNSINSCFDGVDNDFDGKIDMQDDSCNFRLKKEQKTAR